jgi:hypothetical protein
MWSMLQSKSYTVNVDGNDDEEDAAGVTVECPQGWGFGLDGLLLAWTTCS